MAAGGGVASLSGFNGKSVKCVKSVGRLALDLLDWTFGLTLAMFLLTVTVATFDIVVVWFGVWIPMRRATAPEDRPYLWTGVAQYARASREQHETEERMRNARKR